MSRYDVRGPFGAPTVVFVHGTRVTRAMWEPQLDALSDQFRTVAIDLPGHGAHALVPFRTSTALDEIDRAIEAESPARRAAVVGFSLGGYMAIEYAAARPERTAGLVLCSASLEPRRLLTAPLRMFAFIGGLINESLRQEVSRRASRTVSAGAGTSARAAAGLTFKGSRQAVIEVIGGEFRPKLASYPGPVLLVNGADDHVFRRGESSFLAATPNGSLRVVETAGHMVSQERPEEVNAELRRFLGGLDW